MSNTKSKNKEYLKFLESIIYMILIITTIIASTYGNIYLKIIPLLFFLGIVGRLIYSRPVITSIFGGTFSIITMHFNGTYSINEILISGLVNTVLILCGEIFAICVITCIDDIKKKRSKDTKIKNAIISVLFFILSIYITLYMNGNIFRYETAKERLIDYLKQNYKEVNFEVDGYRYIPFKDRGYSFKVKNQYNNSTYKFIVYENKHVKIYDGFSVNITKTKNNNINMFLNQSIKESNIKVVAEYQSYDKVDILITYITDKKDYKEDLINKIIEINGKLLMYKDNKDISEIKVVVEDLSGNKLSAVYFKFSDYFKQLQKQSEYSYLDSIFEIEYFDF